MKNLKRNLNANQTPLQMRESEILVPVAKILSGPESFDDKAARVLQELIRVTHADRVSLAVPCEGGEGLRIVASTRLDKQDSVTVLAPGQGASSLAIQRGEPVVVNDYASSPNAVPSLVQSGIRSVVALPVKAGGRILGVINVGFLTPGQFDPDFLLLLAAIADGMGTLLENARLQEVERLCNQELEALCLMSKILVEPGELSKKLGRALEEIVRVCEIDDATLVEFSDDGKGVRLIAFSGAVKPSIEDKLTEGSITWRAHTTEKPVIANDYRNHPDFLLEVAMGLGVMSAAAMPVTSDARVLGIVTVSSKKSDHFDGSRVNLLKAMIDGLGALLEKARLQEAEHLRTLELESLFHISKILVEPGELSEKLGRALGELVRVSNVDNVGLCEPDGSGESLALVASAGRTPVQRIPENRAIYDSPSLTSHLTTSGRVCSEGVYS